MKNAVHRVCSTHAGLLDRSSAFCTWRYERLGLRAGPVREVEQGCIRGAKRVRPRAKLSLQVGQCACLHPWPLSPWLFSRLQLLLLLVLLRTRCPRASAAKRCCVLALPSARRRQQHSPPTPPAPPLVQGSVGHDEDVLRWRGREGMGVGKEGGTWYHSQRLSPGRQKAAACRCRPQARLPGAYPAREPGPAHLLVACRLTA